METEISPGEGEGDLTAEDAERKRRVTEKKSNSFS
jgi:hypothetical protein